MLKFVMTNFWGDESYAYEKDQSVVSTQSYSSQRKTTTTYGAITGPVAPPTLFVEHTVGHADTPQSLDLLYGDPLTQSMAETLSFRSSVFIEVTAASLPTLRRNSALFSRCPEGLTVVTFPHGHARALPVESVVRMEACASVRSLPPGKYILSGNSLAPLEDDNVMICVTMKGMEEKYVIVVRAQ